MRCHICLGTGINNHAICLTCYGKGRIHKRKRLHFEVVRLEGENCAPFAVKTQERKNGSWHTAVETYACGNMNAKEMAEFIAEKLNEREVQQTTPLGRGISK